MHDYFGYKGSTLRATAAAYAPFRQGDQGSRTVILIVPEPGARYTLRAIRMSTSDTFRTKEE